MISARSVARAAVVVAAMVLLAAGAARADTHAPWPLDWNNWSDPALWVPIGNKGNTGEMSDDYANGPGRICGAVDYNYRIGKYEVTAGQYTAFLNAVAATDTYGLYITDMDTAVRSYGCNIKRAGSSGNYTYSVASDWANRPVNYVSWGDAARFANWLTNGQKTGAEGALSTEDGSYYLNGVISNAALLAVVRKSPEQGGRYYIPTEDEWYKAAYYDPNKPGGPGYWDYPTGSDSAPSNLLVNPDPGNNANFTFWQSPDGEYIYAIDSPYYRTEVGEFENSESHFGTFDQGGNVCEWNEAIPLGIFRGLRGGSWDNLDRGQLASPRGIGDPADYSLNIGFRVSEVPEPATLSLLALGGLLAIRRRR